MALRQKLATGLTAALLLSGLTGVAVASNDAAPGDPLFGVDQLLEEIGIGDGEAAERIAEAEALFRGGQVAAAIAHAAQAVEVTETEGGVEVLSPETSNASAALRDAAANVSVGDDANTQSQEVSDGVFEMLTWMADQLDPTITPEFDGKTFGEGVASRAKMIAGAPDQLPDAIDNAADNAAAGAGNADDGLDTAEEASDNSEEGLDTADDATDNNESDTADEAREGNSSGRP